MRIPLRYTYATCSVLLATISSGPSGARSGSQTYSPVFSVTVSGDTRTPSVKVSADTVNGLRTSRAAARTRMRNEDNEDFIVLLADKLHSFAQWSIGSLDEPIQRTVHFQNEKDRGGNRQRADEQHREHCASRRSKQSKANEKTREPKD